MLVGQFHEISEIYIFLTRNPFFGFFSLVILQLHFFKISGCYSYIDYTTCYDSFLNLNCFFISRLVLAILRILKLNTKQFVASYKFANDTFVKYFIYSKKRRVLYVINLTRKRPKILYELKKVQIQFRSNCQLVNITWFLLHFARETGFFTKLKDNLPQ